MRQKQRVFPWFLQKWGNNYGIGGKKVLLFTVSAGFITFFVVRYGKLLIGVNKCTVRGQRPLFATRKPLPDRKNYVFCIRKRVRLRRGRWKPYFCFWQRVRLRRRKDHGFWTRTPCALRMHPAPTFFLRRKKVGKERRRGLQDGVIARQRVMPRSPAKISAEYRL